MWDELPFYDVDLDDDTKEDKDHEESDVDLPELELSPQDRAQLCGRSYEIGAPLGEGSFGKVYRGTWDKAVPLAIKSIEVDEDSLKYVIAEILAFDEIKHNHAVQVYDLFVTSTRQLLILMELALGGDLNDFIWRRPEEEDEKKKREEKEKEEENENKDGEDKKIEEDKFYSKLPLPESTVRHFYSQFGDAFKCMHHLGIAHLDIKPENILLYAEKQLCKVSDFGLAYVAYDKQSGQPKVRKTHRGTRYYMAPEVLACDICLNPDYYSPFEADVWSAGVVLYEMLNLAMPFSYDRSKDPITGKSLRNYDNMYRSQMEKNYSFKNENLSKEARSIIKAHLQPDPNRRPSFQEFLSNDPWLNNSFVQ